jgi:hypothetical protein
MAELKPIRRPNNCMVSKDVLELVDAMVREGLGERETLLMLEISRQKLMAHRLLNEGRPVDLGFVILHPSLYRPGWQRKIMEANGRRGLNAFKRRRWSGGSPVFPDVNNSPALNRGQRMRLLMLESFAMNLEERYVYRWIEVEHTRRWWAMVRMVERARLEVLGEIRYAKYIIETAVDALDSTIRLYNKWIAAVSRRAQFSFANNRFGDYWFVQHSDAVRCKGRGWFSFFSGDQLARINGGVVGEPAGLPSETPGVPEVPGVEPQEPDMRAGGGDVSGAQDGTAG